MEHQADTLATRPAKVAQAQVRGMIAIFRIVLLLGSWTIQPQRQVKLVSAHGFDNFPFVASRSH